MFDEAAQLAHFVAGANACAPLPFYVYEFAKTSGYPIALDVLPGVMWHLWDAWARRAEPNILLVHYDDLIADLDGQMRRIAARLDIAVPDRLWPELVHAASFDAMQSRADEVAPDPAGILKDRARFFRRGSSGAGREILTEAELDHYHERAASLAPPDLLTWLHRDP